jgi:NAD(P)H-dependent flavin oxidoreductase YrpB (nitropropane dioxygenase family)
MPPLKMGDLVAEVPIVQGGMSVGISLANLASAVANEGGIGVIGVAGIGYTEPDITSNYAEANKRSFIREIQKARRMSKGVIGVNIMMALSDYDKLIQIAIDEGLDVIFIGTGLLLRMPETIEIEQIKSSKTKIVPIVSSAKGAQVMFNYWSRFYDHVPDGVVVEGPLAGGHLGFMPEDIEKADKQLEKLVPEVVEVVKPFRERYNKEIPVIAAGGIYTGEDIARFIDLGASGVQMATRFIATHECDATIKFKDAIINSSKEDIIIIKSPVGMPGRAVRNQFLEDVSHGIKKPFSCPWKCLRTCDYSHSPYCIALALVSAKEGSLDKGFAFAGANAYRVDRLMYVKELIASLKEEYSKVREE